MLKNLRKINPFSGLLFVGAVFLVSAIVVLLSNGESAETQDGSETNKQNPALILLVFSTGLTALGSIATYAQAREATKQRENSEAPEIAVYFQFNSDKLIYCVIQNLGIEPARNIKVTFNPIPLDVKGKPITEYSLFKEPLLYLPPNEIYRRMLGYSADVIKQNPDPINISINYESLLGKIYTEHITMDLSILKDTQFPAATIQDELKEISKNLEDISHVLQAKRGMKHIVHDR